MDGRGLTILVSLTVMVLRLWLVGASNQKEATPRTWSGPF